MIRPNTSEELRLLWLSQTTSFEFALLRKGEERQYWHWQGGSVEALRKRVGEHLALERQYGDGHCKDRQRRLRRLLNAIETLDGVEPAAILNLLTDARKDLASEKVTSRAHDSFRGLVEILNRVMGRMSNKQKALSKSVYKCDFRILQSVEKILGIRETVEQFPTKRPSPGSPELRLAARVMPRLLAAGLDEDLAREALIIAAVLPYC